HSFRPVAKLKIIFRALSALSPSRNHLPRSFRSVAKQKSSCALFSPCRQAGAGRAGVGATTV
ncbi:MAG: hypothetical protein Q8R89_06785, partial [Desulfomicrobium sp.]|nr:hypothetical protein [Desulfomicrobium sp.]